MNFWRVYKKDWWSCLFQTPDIKNACGPSETYLPLDLRQKTYQGFVLALVNLLRYCVCFSNLMVAVGQSAVIIERNPGSLI